jgi:WD40 repeat protein
MDKQKAFSRLLWPAAALCACSCVMFSGEAASSPVSMNATAATAPSPSGESPTQKTLTPFATGMQFTETMTPSATPSVSGIRADTPLLVMSRFADGGTRYSVYGERGALLRDINSPPSSARLESIFDGDISPDGKYLAAVTDSSPCKYAETHGACSDVLYVYVFNLSTGAVQYSIPLLESPEDLLAEIRRLVIIPYDEKSYPNADDPKAAYDAEMEKWVGASWDFYISKLGSFAWSADGTQLAYSIQNAKTDTAIRILDVRDGSTGTMAVKPMSVTSLEWSPDGNWILADDYAAGQFVFEGWYVYSRDGKQTLKAVDAGDYVHWIDSHRIAHVLYEFDQRMAVFDLRTKKDSVFFESPMALYALAEDRSFAAIAENANSGDTNLWYCPFDGSARTLLDRVRIGSDLYLADVIAVAPNLVFVALEELAGGKQHAFTIWMYSPGAGQAVLREDVRSYAISHDGAYAAFYSMENELLVQSSDGHVLTQALDSPTVLRWHPRAEVLLAQTAHEVVVVDAESGYTSVLPLAPDATQTIAVWI